MPDEAASFADSLTRFKSAVQRNRAFVYASALAVALAFRLLGLIDLPYVTILGIGGAGVASALGMRWLSRRRGPGAGAPDLVWLLLDVGLVSWAVSVTGGLESPWFGWYLASISGAAFILGARGSFLVWMASTAGYLLALYRAGDVTGPGPEMSRALATMLVLYAACFFFIRGVSVLQQKRRVIGDMQSRSRREVEELTRLTATLEERTRELADANLRLREADRLKSQFLANVSHELRTPLNSIIGFSEVLQNRLGPTLDERQARFLGYIHSSGEQLLGIINDILDLSKIEAGEMELAPERLPVRSAVDGVRTVLKSVAARKGIAISVEVAEDARSVEADPVRMKQVLYHLIANAIKFSHPDSAIAVRARRLGPEESPLRLDSVEIEVEDRGVGIAPEDREAIFHAFRQVDGTASREHQGAGLGLALVQRVVELHGGLVGVESALGTGSTFRVVLPRRFRGRGADHLLRQEAALEGSEAGHRILVVEDDPTIYEAMSRDLAAAGWLPVRARTGEEALRLARSARPVAITLDVVLPGADGLTVLRELRAAEDTRHIPVVIVSVLDNRELGLMLGADEYLVKPVDRDLLLRRLAELVPREPDRTRRLLVIDDDPRLHDLLAATFQRPGYELLHAFSGGDGVDLARREAIDLVLLDLMMEEMDGFEAATVLKGHRDTRGIPIVVFTAKDMTSDDRARLHGKIEALVQKAGWTPQRLESVVQDVVRRHGQEAIRG